MEKLRPQLLQIPNRRHCHTLNSRQPQETLTEKNGGTVQWHASVILATCMIMWLMARQHSRKDMSRNLTDFGALVEYIRINAKDMSRGHQFGKRTLMGIFLGHVQRAARVGQVT